MDHKQAQRKRDVSKCTFSLVRRLFKSTKRKQLAAETS